MLLSDFLNRKIKNLLTNPPFVISLIDIFCWLIIHLAKLYCPVHFMYIAIEHRKTKQIAT